MTKNKFGEHIYGESDICDLIMQGHDVINIPNLTVDREVDTAKLQDWLADTGSTMTWTFPEESDISVTEFDKIRQNNWFMPDEYRNMDIAEHVLSLCSTQEQLQRAGQELLLYQHHDLFDLLRFMKYLVDVMKHNNVIWGVGRGSSVASYVLYLLQVHRIDSMYYDLDPREFLR